MSEIAVYGKGGIGKSTICANLSAALSESGKKVIQIGCDPKHDSTRLLTQGKSIPTVLDYIKTVSPADYKIQDILFTGFSGIGCVEAGGPTPGVGCAGRGILTAFELLEQFDIKKKYDLTIYDVLGDVVCGGFAVPIRREYAQIIFVVTSGEYMSIYAANNILRGIRNYDNDQCRVGGIIFNKRNIEMEEQRVLAFSRAVGLPVCAEIPRDNAFAQSEKKRMTVTESGQAPHIKKIFTDLASEITNGIKLYEARPLSDEELEYSVFGTRSSETEAFAAAEPKEETAVREDKPAVLADFSSQNRFLSKNVLRNEPLHGCAFNGAVTTALHIGGAAVVAHAPKSCSYISYQSFSSSGRRALFERGSILPVSIAPNFYSTDMDETDIVFGGTEKLKSRIEEIKKRKPKAIIIVTSCPPGIIGDDTDSLESYGEGSVPVIALKADGNLTGDYLQGMLLSYTSLARRIIKKDTVRTPDTINVVFEKVIAKNTEDNFIVMKNIMDRLGISVNCRFLCSTSYESLENFLSAPLNVLAYADYTGKLLKDFFESEYGCEFMKKPFPVGMKETSEWIREAAAFYGRENEAEKLISETQEEYKKQTENLRTQMSGKKLFIMTYNHDIDWIISACTETGIEVVKIGILDFSQDEGYRTSLGLDLNIETNYNRSKFDSDVSLYKPDIILTNYSFSHSGSALISDTIPMCPDTGFYSGINMIRRWAGMLRHKIKGNWREDERLFKKYYT